MTLCHFLGIFLLWLYFSSRATINVSLFSLCVFFFVWKPKLLSCCCCCVFLSRWYFVSSVYVYALLVLFVAYSSFFLLLLYLFTVFSLLYFTRRRFCSLSAFICYCLLLLCMFSTILQQRKVNNRQRTDILHICLCTMWSWVAVLAFFSICAAQYSYKSARLAASL